MSEADILLVQSVSRLLADACSARELAAAERGVWPQALWSGVSDLGLPFAFADEAAGGFGIPLVEAFSIVRLCGEFALPVPLPETMLANRLLGLAGLPLRTAPATFVAHPDLTLTQTTSGWRLCGTAPRVPWGRHADIVALVARDDRTFLANVERNGVAVTPGETIAKEPRDSVIFDAALSADAVAPLGDPIGIVEIQAWGAAIRSNQIAGALERIAAMTIRYAQERSQFGRPIGKFQAVQQNIAVLAEQAAAARAAADLAAEACAGEMLSIAAIAAAKVRAGEAADVAAGIAHQVHGAMGFAQEYGLHYWTRRLWSWRDEFGSEVHWSALLGRDFARAGADRLWAEIASV